MNNNYSNIKKGFHEGKAESRGGNAVGGGGNNNEMGPSPSVGHESSTEDDTEEASLIHPGERLKKKVEGSTKISIKNVKPNVIVEIVVYLIFVAAFLILIVRIILLVKQTLSDTSAQKELHKKLRQRINYAMEIIKAFENDHDNSDSVITRLRPIITKNKKKVREIELYIQESNKKAGISPGYFHYELSCSNILQKNPTSSSGYYFIRSASGQLRNVYCKMDGCGSSKGGWMRLADFNTSSNCPKGLKSKTFSGIKTCVRVKDEIGCPTWDYVNLDIPYSKVCGRIQGYMIGTPDGFHRYGLKNKKQPLSGNYVDGIGVFSRKTHIRTFVGGHCNCNFKHKVVPPFVGKDYSCSNPYPKCFKPKEICVDRIIGDSQLCEGKFDMFNKNLKYRNAAISVKICNDQVQSDEDIGLKLVELYVQ